MSLLVCLCKFVGISPHVSLVSNWGEIMISIISGISWSNMQWAPSVTEIPCGIYLLLVYTDSSEEKMRTPSPSVIHMWRCDVVCTVNSSIPCRRLESPMFATPLPASFPNSHILFTCWQGVEKKWCHGRLSLCRAHDYKLSWQVM